MWNCLHDGDAERNRHSWRRIGLFVLALVALTALAGPVVAAGGEIRPNHDAPTTNETGGTDIDELCEFEHPEWRDAQTIAGVRIDESRNCRPDNPYRVAAAVKGTNNVPTMVNMKSGYHPTTIEKSNDRDGDGDPDVIHIRLEVSELNGYDGSGPNYSQAPGVERSMWVFSPRTRGMVNDGSRADGAIKAPSPPIRAEAGDTIRVTVQNTHYFPHTIHFHGVDHPFERNGSGAGNDGVPQTSEKPIEPGESRTYEFTPEQAGTMFYHCHVVPNVHVEMGLSGMFVITENESNNRVQTLNLGAGKVRAPSEAADSEYDGSYDLHYQALDKGLSSLPQEYNDPRTLARQMNREHDVTDEQADYFMLNGRSFPYTLQHSPILVERDSRYRLRVLNSGPGTISLHTHGHKVIKEALDGIEVAERNEIQRDVVEVSPAQRVDLTLNTSVDGRNSYGEGVWFTHDHREKAVTTDGIAPGGGITVIAYESYFDESAAMPAVNVGLSKLFNASYYDGEIPVWAGLDDRLTDDDRYDDVEPTHVAHGPHDEHMHGGMMGGDSMGDDSMSSDSMGDDSMSSDSMGDDSMSSDSMGGGMMMDMQPRPSGLVVNPQRQAPPGCAEVSGTREVTVGAGEDYAEEGEMYAYNKSSYDFDPCTRVTVTLVNHDNVRHQWMIHGLPKGTYPMGMFNVEADAGETITGTFVTPPESGDLHLHCSLPQHQQKGMHGHVSVGDHAGDDHSESGDGDHSESGDGDHSESSGSMTATTAGGTTTGATTAGGKAGDGPPMTVFLGGLVVAMLVGVGLVVRGA